MGSSLSLIASEPAGQVGDANPELMTAKEVGALLRIAAKKVYELPLPRVELSQRRVRWLRVDVLAYIRRQRHAA
jgi:predicted DNA-binding transcriptional regulator AlpA